MVDFIATLVVLFNNDANTRARVSARAHARIQRGREGGSSVSEDIPLKKLMAKLNPPPLPPCLFSVSTEVERF